MWKYRLAIVAAAVVAYLPALNNGFIADDFVILHRIDILKADPFYLFTIVPESFRLTSYAVFGALKSVFGYDYRVYYVFNILLHALNCLLLERLVAALSGRRDLSHFSALLFAVSQAPQEAVMWLAAMNETLLGLFVFLALLAWLRRSYMLAALLFFLALFSKESALVLLLIIPLMERYRGGAMAWRSYLWLLAPSALFAAVFVATLAHNFQIGNGTYVFGPHAALVLLKSLHRLFWPWAYAVVIGLFLSGQRVPWRSALAWGGLIVVSMLPYVFVTYTNNIPSRQVYLASAAFLPLLAAAMLRVRPAMWASAFLTYNLVYMWTTKDRQMAERAAPTTALIQELRMRQPGRIVLAGFAYPFVDVAKGAAVTVPGWLWDQVELGESCPGCTVLEWQSEEQRYAVRR